MLVTLVGVTNLPQGEICRPECPAEHPRAAKNQVKNVLLISTIKCYFPYKLWVWQRLSTMNFNPPVSKRSTKELFNIISNSERWSREIQIFAQKELLHRNFSNEQIEAEKNKRKGILKRLKERQTNIDKKHKKESYDPFDMITIILFYPITFVINRYSGLSEFGRLSAGNYKKKFRQRIILCIISLIVWLGVIYSLF